MKITALNSYQYNCNSRYYIYAKILKYDIYIITRKRKQYNYLDNLTKRFYKTNV